MTLQQLEHPGSAPVLAPALRRRRTTLGVVLTRRAVGLGRTGAVWEALLPAMLEQRITGTEAWRNYRRLVRAHGEPAPGPGRELRLWVQPTPDTISASHVSVRRWSSAHWPGRPPEPFRHPATW